MAGARAYVYDIGSPLMQVRDPSGRVMAAGPTPREITVVFDTSGHPLLLADEAGISRFRQGSAVVTFSPDHGPAGYREIAVTDSAAVMTQVRREGLTSLNEAIRQNTRTEREPLDSVGLQRASLLAEHLWARGCVSNLSPPAPLRLPPELRGPTTLAALLASYREFRDGGAIPAQLPRCVLPEVGPGPDWVSLPGPDDSLTLRLPAGWAARPSSESSSGPPERVYDGPDGARIAVGPVVGRSGHPFLATAAAGGRPVELAHGEMCQVGDGPSGSIWTLYPPDPAAASGPFSQFNAIGDLITAGGKRYGITIRAQSAGDRDRLLSIVAGAK